MDPERRLQFFEYSKHVAQTHDRHMCGFEKGFKIIKRIGSESKFGEVYLTEADYEGQHIEAAMKMLPVKSKNKAELDFYKTFNNYVTSYVNPHYPLVFFTKTCTNCPFERFDKKECYIAFKELADGDLKMWIQKKHSKAEFASLWAQICIMGMGLEKAHIIHKDLHWGNMLFHETPKENKNKYYHYIIGGQNVYVKMVGYHWVVWDFGKTIDEQLPYNTSLIHDMYKIGHMARWLLKAEPRTIKPPKFLIDLCENIINFCTDAQYQPSRVTYADLMDLLHTKLKTIAPTILLINPKTPPKKALIINATPFVV